MATLGEGDILGWSWLMPPYHWQFHARAVEVTRAIALDGKCLRTKCEQNHDLGYELLKRFCHIIERRLEATRLQLLDVYGSPRVTMARRRANDPMLPQPLPRCGKWCKETPDTFTLTLEPLDGCWRNRLSPGQFSMLYVFGVGELPISISGDPEQRGPAGLHRALGGAGHSCVGEPRSGRQGGRARSIWNGLARGAARGQRRASSWRAASAWRRCGR